MLNLFQQKLNLTLTKHDIDRSHRVGLPQVGKTRAILVKFVSYRDRAAVFNQKKMLKSSNYSIKEDLTKYRLNVLQEAAKKYNWENVWTSDGRIVIKTNNRKFYITSKEQFPKSTEGSL